MKQGTLIRQIFSDKEVLGTLHVPNEGDIWLCKTLERPDLKNLNNVSCIPFGTYLCKYTRSNRFSAIAGKDYFTYEVLNVPGRAGIRIHSANYVEQINGCIALGSAHLDINHDGTLDLASSKVTMAKFEELMNKENFMLTVKKI